MEKRNKKRWYFYVVINEHKKILDSNRVCKAPELTSNYKRLINEFNKGFIDGYGYTSLCDNWSNEYLEINNLK